MKLEKETIEMLKNAICVLERGFKDLPSSDIGIDKEGIERVISELAIRMRNNYPYFHPFYAGQMLKPPHPVARLAYMLSLWINPNNHALDGGRESSRLEKEAVSKIAEMFGWEEHLGHLTSAGTTANLEALWIAGELHPGKTIVASGQAHYTHSRLSSVLKLPFESVPSDAYGMMDTGKLEDMLKKGNVGIVVATVGTTGTGSVDPVNEIIELKKKYGFRLHIDAAYGGYFTLCSNLNPDTKKKFDMIGEADSIVIDPHKHGLQPYGCGCILFKDTSVGRFYKHDSPYTYFTSDELHLGEISLECSRAGASAAALWSTMQLLPLINGGDFAAGLEKGIDSAKYLYKEIVEDPGFFCFFKPELDIVIWAPRGESFSDISKKTELLFEKLAEKDLHLAKFRLSEPIAAGYLKNIKADSDYVTCLRSCLMKPEHFEWKERIWNIIKETGNELN